MSKDAREVLVDIVEDILARTKDYSREDIAVTERIKKGADVLGINFIDHIVIGDRCYQSISEHSIIWN